MKYILPLVIELKGSCKGITTFQIDRTDRKALYKRSDGYWECFIIKVTRHSTYKDGKWIRTEDTIERYPHDESFGSNAWCGGENSIRKIYETLD